MVRKHTKICPVSLVPTTVDLQVILNEVLGKYKILPGAYKKVFRTLQIQSPVSGFL